MRVFRVVLGALVAAGAATALAEDDVKEILKKCDAATKAVKSVSYDSEIFMEGEDADAARKGTAKVRAAKIEGKDDTYKVFIDGKLGAGDSQSAMTFGTDGKTAVMIDHAKKTYSKGTSQTDVMMVLNRARQSFHMLEYTHPTPFQDEVNADSAKIEGEKKIGDVDCHVIYVVYAGGQGESRWYFGKKDHLPRRVERIGEGSSMVTQLTNLKVDPSFEADAFTPAAPSGYEEKKLESPRRAEEPKLLANGDAAPNWTLETPGGDKVELATLKGKVVVLDFWAVWCGPCKKAMPAVQALHEKYKDKGVAIYGVNVWERDTNDPAGFMKEKGYTYGLLLKGDDVAKEYKVPGIPTFYVIGKDGKIVHSAVGAGEDAEKTLDEAIQKALAGQSG